MSSSIKWVVILKDGEGAGGGEAVLCNSWVDAHGVCREADLAGLVADCFAVCPEDVRVELFKRPVRRAEARLCKEG